MPFTPRENVSVVVVPVVVDEYDNACDDPARTAFSALPRIADDLTLLRALFESAPYADAGFQFLDPLRGADAAEIARGLKQLRLALLKCARPLMVLVFWSGHAMTVDNQLRLVTRDCFEPMTRSDGYAPADLAGQLADSGVRSVFLMLDVCQAAAASPEVFEAVARRSVDRPIGQALSMAALFAAYPLELAPDGAFAECLTRLLRFGPSPAARQRMEDEARYPINPRSRLLTLSEVAEALQLELDALPPGRRRSHPWPISAGLPPPLFPNPDYQPKMPPTGVARPRQAARAADLETHFLPKARGLEPGEAGWFFSGRRRLCAEVVRWIDPPDATTAAPLLLLTGRGGTGKSALIGRLVALSDGPARVAAQAQGWDEAGDTLAGTVPRIGAIDAALNLRGLSNEQVMQVLGELLEVAQPGVAVDPSSFVTRLPATRGTPPRPTTVVFDALDEATDPARLAGSLIPSLVRRGLRVLVAGRPTAEVARLLEAVRGIGPARTLDMDGLDDVRDDIREYVVARLRDWPQRDLVRELAEVVAERAQGTFLFARMATAALMRTGWEGATSASLAERIGRGVGEELERELRTMDLAFGQRFERGDRGASALFVALAWSEGSGLPLRDHLWPRLATALGAISPALEREHAQWVLHEGGRYIVEAGDGEQATYRLYHQALVDELRARRDLAAPEAVVTAALEAHAAEAGGWDGANPYAVRHVVFHAVAARSAAPERTAYRWHLERIVCRFDWIRAKLTLDGPYVLLDDMGRVLAADPRSLALPRVERAVRQSAAVLARDPSQLAGQLLGRLAPGDPGGPESRHPAIRRLLRDAQGPAPRAWLRPRVGSLSDEASRRWLRPTPSESMHGMAFSRNGRWAVHFGFESKQVNLWDLAAWQQLGPLFRPDATVNAMAITDDARHVLYAQGHTVWRWSAGGEPVCLGDVHPLGSSPTRLHLSEDGRYALSGTSDGTSVVAWDFEARSHELLVENSRRDVAAVHLDRNGLGAVIVRESGRAERMQLWPARVVARFEYRSAPALLACSDDGRMLLALDNEGEGDLRELDMPAHPAARLRSPSGPRSAALSADGRSVAVGTADGSVLVGLLASDRERVHWSVVYDHGHTYDVDALTFSGSRVMSADSIQLKEWEPEAPVEAPAESSTGPLMDAQAGLVLAKDGITAYALSHAGLVAWDVQTVRSRLEVRMTPASSWRPQALSISTSEPVRLMSWTAEAIEVFDPAGGRAHVHRPEERVSAVAMSADGKSVAYATSEALFCWEIDRGEVRRIGDLMDRCRAVAFSPDHTRLVACIRNDVSVWQLSMSANEPVDEETSRTRLASDSASQALFIDERKLLVADAGGHLFEVDTAERGLRSARQFAGRHPSDVSVLLCTQDGRHALTTSPFGGATVWDVAEGRMQAHWPVGGIAFRMSEPFGRALLSTPDGVLQVISLVTGEVIAAFQADRQIIAGDADDALAHIVVCDQGGRVHVLSLEG